MRGNLRRATHLVLFLVFAAVLGVGFQNCAGYNSDYNPLYDNASEGGCANINCAADADGIAIEIGQTEVWINKKAAGAETPTSCEGNNVLCFDLAGFCDKAGFVDSVFYIDYKDNQSNPFSSGLVETRINGAHCDSQGRFKILVTVPSGYLWDKDFTVWLRMKGVDESGEEIDNPRGINRKSVLVRLLQ